MSIKKYRLYLLMAVLVVVIVGALSLLYYSENNTKGQGGTLVMRELSPKEKVNVKLASVKFADVEDKTGADWEMVA